MYKKMLFKKVFSIIQVTTVLGNIQTGPHSHYAALLEPTSSQPLRPNQTLASEEKAGIVDVMEDNSSSETNHSDVIKSKDDTSLSDDIRDTSKLEEILSKFVLTEPLAQQFDRTNIQYHNLYQNTQGNIYQADKIFPPSDPTAEPRFLSMDPVQNDLNLLGIKQANGDGYNIHIPPLPREGGPLLVSISISLRNILEIDELRQLITLETTMRLYWQDYRLNVSHLLPINPHKNASDDYILLHPDTAHYIWFPDIYIDFAKDLRIPKFMVAPASLRIYRNSTVRYATQNNYDVACPMNFRKYPYDTQICKVKYESYGYTTQKMLLKWKKGFDQSKVTANNSISLAQFDYAVKFDEEYREAIASGEYPGVIMTIVLRRKINYHLLQTYLPSGLFVIVAWLSLFLPPESIPGRVAMAMTTLLTLAAMFGSVRQNTPRVSYVSALDVWMCGCIVFVFFTLLEYVIVLCIIYHKPKTTKKEENNCSKSVGMQTIDRKDPNILQLEDIQRKKERPRFCPTWRRGGSSRCRPKEVVHTHCVHKSAQKPPNSNTEHLFVEKWCRRLIAIMFIAFNGIYWPLLTHDDGTIDKEFNLRSGILL